jgi:esterase/lipase superfamily enzyme
MYKKIVWLLLLVILALSLEIFRREFTGLGQTPDRGSFSGRLPFTVEGDFRRFQFFYSTNREKGEESFQGRGNQLSPLISNGVFDVLIQPGLTIRPFEWFETDRMRIDGITGLNEKEFYPRLKDAVSSSPNKSLLVVVWGFRDWFQSAALKTAYTGYILDINTPVVLFDWPGNQGEGARGYFAARSAAAATSLQLGRWLNELKERSGAEKIWVMGSSLGCQVITDALVWINDHHPAYKLSHVILSAPDISNETFNNKLKESIPNTSEHLTTYVSSNDRALLMSVWLNQSRSLGRIDVSLPPDQRAEPHEFEDGKMLLDYGLREITVIDATPINQTRNLHHFFTDSPEFFDDLYQRLLDPNQVISRRLHELRSEGGREYWILWSF